MNSILMTWGAKLLSMILFLGVTAHCRADDTIKLGVITARSGAYKTSIGDVYLEGARFAVDAINDGGGLLGRKVEIVPIDSEFGEPDVAIKNVKKAIRDHNIKFFDCESSSRVARALIKVMEDENALWYASVVASADFTGSNASRNFFRCNHNTNMIAKAIVANVVEEGYRKIFVVAQDYSFGRQASEAFIEELNSADPTIEIVGSVLHPLKNRDFTPLVSQVISTGADAVVTTDYGGDLVLLLKTSYQMGYTGRFVAYYLNFSSQMQALGDEATLGHLTSESYLMTVPTEANRAFVKQFLQKTGHYPEKQGKPYMATMFWAEAVKKAGSLEVDKVIEAWEGLTYEGPAGTWTMRAFDHQTLLPIWTAHIVHENPYFDHAYLGEAVELPAERVSIPVERTGAPGFPGHAE